MTTLHDHIQMLRAELTSFYLSHGERRRIERELKLACAQFAADRYDEPPPRIERGAFRMVARAIGYPGADSTLPSS
ncbi:hypothetical protein [Komagataeibacter xylinus]|uniref:Uncharacterized protein n=1 Tax=Komagataeibacter xylinus TaxID=28448 RepID=A0A857FLE0_KOMXY|nr:hypothetical protein [Komagataeibacter xylinus]QHC34319.1 hypothetical protein FMA36_01250 [Komagataeibacter xylinus]